MSAGAVSLELPRRGSLSAALGSAKARRKKRLTAAPECGLIGVQAIEIGRGRGGRTMSGAKRGCGAVTGAETLARCKKIAVNVLKMAKLARILLPPPPRMDLH